MDEKGETKKLDEETPWKLTLKDVPVGVKSVFRGKLYCISTDVIKGYILMQATDPRNGKVLYRNKKEMDASKYVSGSLGYTGAEMDKETSFQPKTVDRSNFLMTVIRKLLLSTVLGLTRR